MKLETLGHASLLLTSSNGSPILLTDPWLIGSSYWRSWWLQHYPSLEEIESVKSSKFVYLTHEHPDHFHPPSLRRLNKETLFLCPDLPDMSMADYLQEQAYQVKNVSPYQWMRLHEECSILSIPLWNDDSILLVLTQDAFIINLNDTKPNSSIIKQINKVRSSLGPRKTIVLSSYSPAGIVNSFIEKGERLSLRNKVDYVKYLNKLNTSLCADFFIPFASQVTFLRSDSKWANDYKVAFEDLQMHWDCKTTLLHPYSTINFETNEISFVHPSEYRIHNQTSLIEQRETQERAAVLLSKDITTLEKKLNASRYLYALLFPKGVGFEVNLANYIYSPVSGRIKQCDRIRIERSHFSIQVPAQTLKEALENEHLGDIGISMFINIELHRKIDLKLIYLFFMLITVHDYKHSRSVKEFLRWMTSTVWNTMFRSAKIPIPNF
jgi:hypothetical protein